ncbi:hypothetical protein GOP47_0021241, partial [Adiantum capillus-veneris]
QPIARLLLAHLTRERAGPVVAGLSIGRQGGRATDQEKAAGQPYKGGRSLQKRGKPRGGCSTRRGGGAVFWAASDGMRQEGAGGGPEHEKVKRRGWPRSRGWRGAE